MYYIDSNMNTYKYIFNDSAKNISDSIWHNKSKELIIESVCLWCTFNRSYSSVSKISIFSKDRIYQKLCFLALSNIRAAKVNFLNVIHFNIFEFKRLCVTQHVISNLRTMGDSDCSFTFYSRSAVNIFSRVRETNSTNTRALICKRGGGNNAFKELPCLANQPNELFVIICTKTPTDHRTLDGKKFKNQSGC